MRCCCPRPPCTPPTPRSRQIPSGVNESLGRFTNFVNLMDLAALALPGPQRADGLPFGVTLLAPAFGDRRLLELGATWTGESPDVELAETMQLVVAGAHMSGLPLNPQLTELGARLLRAERTAPVYRLYALPGEGIRDPASCASATRVRRIERRAVGDPPARARRAAVPGSGSARDRAGDARPTGRRSPASSARPTPAHRGRT